MTNSRSAQPRRERRRDRRPEQKGRLRPGPSDARTTEGRTSAWLPRLLPWLAVALALLVFAGALGYPFVDDDSAMVVKHPHLGSWKFLPKYFVEDVWGESRQGETDNFYRPLQMVWLRTMYSFSGLEPAGYHAGAIALHALATLLLYLLARRILEDRIAAGFAALIFAVHPLHAEAVAWISGSTEPLFSAFFLAAFLCYLRSRDAGSGASTYDLRFLIWAKPRAEAAGAPARGGLNHRAEIPSRKSLRWFLLSLLCYALALLSKETAVVLFPLIFLHEWRRQAERQRGASGEQPAAAGKPPAAAGLPGAGRSHLLAGGRAAWAALPYLALTAAYLAARLLALRGFAPYVRGKTSPHAILISLPQALWFYLRKLVWPMPMAFFYPLRVLDHAGLRNFAWPLAASLAVLAGLWFWARQSRAAAEASVLLLLPLATPLFGISRAPANDLVHDRWLYLPSVGLAMLIALAIRRLPSGRRIAGAPVAQMLTVAILVGLLGATSAVQARSWESSLALYRHALEVSPGSRALQMLAGEEIVTLRDYHEALPICERALAEDPDSYILLIDVGLMRRALGDPEGALAVWRRAQRLRPADGYSHYMVAAVDWDLGRLTEAEAEMREAVRLRPNETTQHLFIAELLERRGRLEEARAEYLAELQINPNSADARARLAAIEALLNLHHGNAPTGRQHGGSLRK
jgi:tetratricopeptide (TPR) repeat protein